QLNLATYLEDSRRGGHLWLFVEPVQALVMRTLIRLILDTLEIDNVEIYPQQDGLVGIRVGSLVRGPLGVHQLTGQRYSFLDPVQLKPIGLSLEGQLDYLLTFQVNSIHQVAEALTRVVGETHQSNQDLHAQAPLDRDKIEVLKAAIGDLYTFVSQYVQLDARGRGSCPFHPPDRHPSFAVNREEGYWVCFHQTNPETGRYLGGDAIEFYKRLKGLTFKEAVRELADQYGVTDLPF
ncbi:MAG: CHC2 zinc finger domain-containing protein, partial [Candidatus Zixiibacteriota bacterium]